MANDFDNVPQAERFHQIVPGLATNPGAFHDAHPGSVFDALDIVPMERDKHDSALLAMGTVTLRHYTRDDITEVLTLQNTYTTTDRFFTTAGLPELQSLVLNKRFLNASISTIIRTRLISNTSFSAIALSDTMLTHPGFTYQAIDSGLNLLGGSDGLSGLTDGPPTSCTWKLLYSIPGNLAELPITFRGFVVYWGDYGSGDDQSVGLMLAEAAFSAGITLSTLAANNSHRLEIDIPVSVTSTDLL